MTLNGSPTVQFGTVDAAGRVEWPDGDGELEFDLPLGSLDFHGAFVLAQARSDESQARVLDRLGKAIELHNERASQAVRGRLTLVKRSVSYGPTEPVS